MCPKISLINAPQPFMGVNEMHIKLLQLLCQLGLVLRLGSVYRACTRSATGDL